MTSNFLLVTGWNWGEIVHNDVLWLWQVAIIDCDVLVKIKFFAKDKRELSTLFAVSLSGSNATAIC